MKSLFQFVHRFIGKPKKRRRSPQTYADSARVISRTEHSVSRKHVSENALKVLYRLHNSGYQSYIVGGGIRDLLLGLSPKDFDVVTDATPHEVQKLFRNCRLIGRRFRLAHVYFREEIVEVATFRSNHDLEEMRDGMIVHDNEYGTIDQDVWRRDFTVNAIYYNIADFSLVDYVDGLSDLNNRILRMIGDPDLRYREDPVRMLRAIRLSAKLGFTIEPATAASIKKNVELIRHVSPSRLFDEIQKLFKEGAALAVFKSLLSYGFIDYLFPSLAAYLKLPNAPSCHAFLEQALKNTDQRISEEKPVTIAFVYASFLWYPLEYAAATSSHTTFQEITSRVLSEQQHHSAMPRKITHQIQEIWLLQHTLTQREQRKIEYVFHHPRFRAAYDFLQLRALIDETLVPHERWWTTFQKASNEERDQMISTLKKNRKRRRRARNSR